MTKVTVDQTLRSKLLNGQVELCDEAGQTLGFFLTAEEYACGRSEGVWIWIESFIAADAAVRKALGEWVYTYLSEMNVKGLLVSSSDPQGEADCRWLGMVELRDR